MPLRIAPLAPVLLGVVCAQAALGLMTPLIPLLLLRAGASAPAIGVVASAYFLGFLGGALTADRVVTRVGHIRAFAVFAAIAADAAMLLVLGDAAWQVALLRLLIGYACSGMFLVAESWLNDRADTSTRGRIFGAYLVASWGASALGPLALNVVRPTPLLFVWVGLAFATAVLPMALTVQSNPPVPQQAHMGIAKLFRVSPVGVVCALASGLTNSAYYALAPVYLRSLGYGTPQVAAFISVGMVAGLAVQVPVGWLSDRFGRRRLTVAVLLVSLLAAVAMAAAGRLAFGLFAAIGFVYAGATAPLYGLGAGQTNDRMQRGDYVAASGALLFTWSLGSSVGPSLAGAAMGRFGPMGLFFYLTLVLGLAAGFTVWRILVRARVPPEQRGTFVASLAAPARNVQFAARMMHTLRHPADAAPTVRALLRRQAAP
jgi:MFS family permease